VSIFQKIGVVEKIDKILKLVSQQILVKNYDKVRDYLSRFPDLLDLIPKVIEVARRNFPDGSFVLDLYEDPEIVDQYLVLYIRLKNYDETFSDRLKETQKQFIYNLENKDGWIQLTTDFQPKE
jgi:hypothetical protein